MAASLVTRRLLFAVLLQAPSESPIIKAGPAANIANRPFGRKSVATNCKAAKFKAVKPTKPRARAGRFKKGIGVAGFFGLVGAAPGISVPVFVRSFDSNLYRTSTGRNHRICRSVYRVKPTGRLCLRVLALKVTLRSTRYNHHPP